MTASTLFATLVLLVLAVDEAAGACGLSNVGAQTEVLAYTVTTYTAAGTYVASDVCTTSFSAPTNYKLLFQPTSVDVPCAANGAAGSDVDGDDLAYHPSADGSGTAIIAANDGCSNTAVGTAKTNYPVKATTGVALSAVLTADAGGSTGAGYTVKYVAGKDDAGTCSTSAQALTGALTAEHLTSTGFPAVISGSAEDCLYTITTAAAAHVVKATPIVMDVAGTAGSCGTNDHVQLLDGDSTSTTELAKLCDTLWTFSPVMYYSTLTKMSIVVKMSINAANYGFALKYEDVPSACGSAADTASATAYTVATSAISSIPVSSTCSYTYTAPATYKLLVQLDPVDFPCGSAGVTATTVQIYDGTDTTTALVTDGCGTAASSTTKTTGVSSFVQIVTASASVVTAKTFTVNYIAGKENPPASDCSTTAKALSATSTAAYLTSPGFPGAISGSAKECVYTITADTNTKVVKVTPLFIDLQGTLGACGASDYVKLLDGDSSSTAELAKLCDTKWSFTTADYTSSLKQLSVKVKMSVQTSNFGFALKYESMAGQCVLTYPSTPTITAFTPGTIAVTAYIASAACEFTLGAPATYKMLMHLTSVDVPCSAAGTAGGTADGDDLVIKEDDTNGAVVLAANSGCSATAVGTPVTDTAIQVSAGTTAFIKLTADAGSSLGAGFTLKYIAGKDMSGTCVVAGGTPTALTATAAAKFLTSAGFPGTLGGTDNCEYEITVTNTGKKIQAAILFIDLPVEVTCTSTTNYLKLLDGDSTATALAYICKKEWSTTTYMSSLSKMTVQFKSNDNAKYGFALSYIEASAAASLGQSTLIVCILAWVTIMVGQRH